MQITGMTDYSYDEILGGGYSLLWAASKAQSKGINHDNPKPESGYVNSQVVNGVMILSGQRARRTAASKPTDMPTTMLTTIDIIPKCRVLG